MKAQKRGECVTDLRFLLTLPTLQSRTAWTLEQAQLLLSRLKGGASLKQLAKMVRHSHSGTRAFVKELIEAANKGYTLEGYFAAGRPFSPGKKEAK